MYPDAGLVRGKGRGEYFHHAPNSLANLRGSRKREVDSGHKFNGQTAGVRMHALSWLGRTRESGGRESRGAGNGGWARGEKYKRWKKGPRKHYDRNIALTRVTSHLSLAVYAVSQRACIHKRIMCSQRAYDIRYDIWYFTSVCASFFLLAKIRHHVPIILSLNKLMILGTICSKYCSR